MIDTHFDVPVLGNELIGWIRSTKLLGVTLETENESLPAILEHPVHLREFGATKFAIQLPDGMKVRDLESSEVCASLADKSTLRIRIPKHIIQVFSWAQQRKLAKRTRTAAVLIVRNEARYLGEWIEYHRELGFSYFFVFNNQSTDDIEFQLEKYTRLGIVELVSLGDIPGEIETRGAWALQNFIYNVSLRRSVAFDRVAFIDIDEFVVDEAAEESPLSTGFRQLPWVWFGSSHYQVDDPTKLVIERFTKREAEGMRTPQVKCIVEPKGVIRFITAHQVENKHKSPAYSDGVKFYETVTDLVSSPTIRGSAVGHFHMKSMEEFERKILRSWPATDRPYKESEAFRQRIDANEVDDFRFFRFVPRIRQRLENLGGFEVHNPLSHFASPYVYLSSFREGEDFIIFYQNPFEDLLPKITLLCGNKQISPSVEKATHLGLHINNVATGSNFRFSNVLPTFGDLVLFNMTHFLFVDEL